MSVLLVPFTCSANAFANAAVFTPGSPYATIVTDCVLPSAAV